MTYRIPMMLAAVVALSTGSAYASIEFPTSTDEARAAAAAANPSSTYAAGGYTLRDVQGIQSQRSKKDVRAVQTPPQLKSNNGDEIRAAIAQATSTSTRAAGGHDPSPAQAVAAAPQPKQAELASALPPCCQKK